VNCGVMSTTETLMSRSFQRLGSLRLSLRSRKDRGTAPPSPTKPASQLPQQQAARVLLAQDTGRIGGAGEDREDETGSCIICVGSTGTGKSSTIAKYTGSRTKSGSGAERVTKSCEIHRCLQDDHEPVWVDTVGWDDAECEDDETFRDILRFIDKYNITKVKAVIWNISPNVRKDALLVGQAKLINMFQEERIWSNVIVVAKQSLNPDHDCQGALRAAEEYTREPLQYTGYRFYEDPTLSPKQREYFVCDETRATYNIKTDPEVKQILQEKLMELKGAVQVVFKTKRCTACSARGDARLLSPFCHMEESMVHPGTIENHHPGGQEWFHPSSHHVIEHTGRLKKSWYSGLCCGTYRKPRFTCCRRRAGKEGCRRKWACCKASWDDKQGGCQLRYGCCGCLVSPTSTATGCSPRYTCCTASVNSPGCRKVCRKCGSEWGGPAGNCFRRAHDLVAIHEPDTPPSKEVRAVAESPTAAEAATELNPFLDDEELSPSWPADGDGHKFFHKFAFAPSLTYHMI